MKPCDLEKRTSPDETLQLQRSKFTVDRSSHYDGPSDRIEPLIPTASATHLPTLMGKIMGVMGNAEERRRTPKSLEKPKPL